MLTISEKLDEVGYRAFMPNAECAPLAVAALSESIGYPLPNDYLQFLSEFPRTGIFDADIACSGIEAAPCAPERIYPISLLYTSCPRESDDLLHLRKIQSETPLYLLIVGVDDGGNYFCLDLRAESLGKMYFLFHEEAAEERMYLLAQDFTTFIQGLHRF